MRKIRGITISAAILCALAACGDRGEDPAAASRSAYRRGVEGALDLYSRLHPLRSSRLDLRSSDSLLFTYSEKEIAEAIDAIDRLSDDLSAALPRHLEPDEADNLTMMTQWLKGERFALEELALYRRTPLLYCWIAEEALFGIPSRPQPPYPGEAEAYERRIARIAPLLARAQRILDNPAERHVTLAVRRINELIARLDLLEPLLARRYGSISGGIAVVRRSLESFSRFCASDLAPRAYGSMILGSDDLSRIFLYDEGLIVDAAQLGREAEAKIVNLKNRARSLRRRIGISGETALPAASKSSPLDSALVSLEADASRRASSARTEPNASAAGVLHDIETLERALARSGTSGARPAGESLVRAAAAAGRRFPIPPNPSLSIPVAAGPMIFADEHSPFADPPCGDCIDCDPALAGIGADAYAYALIGVLSPLREGGLLVCTGADAIRTILASETFREAWDLIQREALIETLGARRAPLELLLVEDKIRSLARMQLVLRLHAGTLTSQEAVGFLTETIDGLTPEEAISEYVLASVSPSIAYRGIALLATENLMTRREPDQGAAGERQRLPDLLRRYAGIPLPLLDERIDR